MKLKIFYFVIVFFMSFKALSNDIFKPGENFYDTDNNIINAHGGGFIKDRDTYYWFGEVRTHGQENTGKVNVYSSKDLYSWKYEGVALDLSNKEGKYAVERPKVIYNEKTKKYVMWYHVELNGRYRTGISGVATADKITGPYEFISTSWLNKNENPMYKDLHEINEKWYSDNVKRADRAFNRDYKKGQLFRDMTLFKDDNGKAYLIFTSEDNLTIHVSELNEDYTDTNGKFSRVLVGLKNEAPTIFKKDGNYYLITSGLKGFTPTDARSAVSKNIFGPWTILGNPVRSTNKEDKKNTFRAQGTYILESPSGRYIYMADRWNVKNLSDSRYVWLPIQWEGLKPVLKWEKEWSY